MPHFARDASQSSWPQQARQPWETLGAPAQASRGHCTAISQFARRLRRINAETQRFAEERKEGRKKRFYSSAFLRALCVSALRPVRLRLRLCRAVALADPLKIPEWLPSTSQATRLRVACRALWPKEPIDSGDSGEKAEGSPPSAVLLRRTGRQNEE